MLLMLTLVAQLSNASIVSRLYLPVVLTCETTLFGTSCRREWGGCPSPLLGAIFNPTATPHSMR